MANQVTILYHTNSLKGPEDDSHLVVGNNVIKYLQSKDGALPAGFNPEGSIQEMTAYLYGQQPSCLRRIWAHKISLSFVILS